MKVTANPAARTTPNVEAASSSTSARAWLDVPQSASGDREYTGQWVKWYGKWYQKIFHYGCTELEEPLGSTLQPTLFLYNSRAFGVPRCKILGYGSDGCL